MSISNKTLPRGIEFFDSVSLVEARCSTESLSELPKLGMIAPACYECLGDVLSVLYAEASCFQSSANFNANPQKDRNDSNS